MIASFLFTGFSSEDDIRVSSLIGKKGDVYRPYPLFNAAMNLVKDGDLAWQERKAAPFTFTPLYTGYVLMENPPIEAYIKSSQYMGGPWMGLIAAVSGAAVNPNMGYHSSPAVTFLLTLFNVRLGRWCPNTRAPKAVHLESPNFGWPYLLWELFGLTDEKSNFVNLSDGGHFENLGLYELVRRECGLIVICDASADKDFELEDLGNAIRKCRVDFGAEIKINLDDLRPDPASGLASDYVCYGSVEYPSCEKKGIVFYVKPALLKGRAESLDVLQYKAASPDFPHETTADQWFDESQFESYRKLGVTIGEKLVEKITNVSAWL